MTGERRVGLTPVPDDKKLEEFLNELFAAADKELSDYLVEFREVLEMTREDQDPLEWAYARLLNNLASLESPQVLRMLSAFIWRMSK